MKIQETNLEGLILIEPSIYDDQRGFFLESYQADRYKKIGIHDEFVQDNHSRSRKGVLRGMHFQIGEPQSQLLTVIRGEIFDVCVDVRKSSRTYGQWSGTILRDYGLRQIYMSPGFAHGFCVLSDWADLHYKVSKQYNHHDEGGLIWNDSKVGINWPKMDFMISARDLKFPKFTDL